MTNHKNIIAVITLTALLVSLAVWVGFVKASPKTITVPDDYPTIQAAVANASPGDTVFVRSGSYSGGMVIDKPISLRGEGATTTSIVGGATAGDLGLSSVALRKTPEPSYPSMGPFAATDETTLTLIVHAEGSKIQPANFIPPLTFVIIVNSNDVTISGFTIMGGDRAIYSSNGSWLQIRENSLGTCILGGSNNTVANNSRIGLTIGGYHNLIANNNGGVVLSSSNSTILENSLSGFALQNAHSNTIINNTLSGSNMGLYIGSSISSGPPMCLYNLFAGNKIESCGLWGILMGAGSYNVFFGNIVENTGAGLDHDGYGLALGGNGLTAENNLFLQNIFKNNTKNFGVNWPVTGSNFFDDGREGNYWDDYLTRYPNATEVGNSGTGNSPYMMTETNVDNHPLLIEPSVSDKVPSLPELWASLLSAPSSSPSGSSSPSQSPLPSQSPIPTLSPSPSIPEFPQIIVFSIPAIAAVIGLIVYRAKRKGWK